MPTQTKKTLAITPTEKASKPKKKKKNLLGRNSKNSRSKTPASGVDSWSEGLFYRSCLFILSTLTVKRTIIVKLNAFSSEIISHF